MPSSKNYRHLRTLFDLSSDDVVDILDCAASLKKDYRNGLRSPLLPGRMLSLLFEKPSLRTRVSFETAITHLRGNSVFQSVAEAGLDGRESLPDISRVLSRYCDAIILRTFSQQLIDDVAEHASCPVINALSDSAHPCQALTDILTIRETFGSLSDQHLVYVGDGNNVARSLCIATAHVGMKFTVCTPTDYAIDTDFLNNVRQQLPTANIHESNDPQTAVTDANVVYTDVWASMGQEAESDARRQIFTPFQVNSELMKNAPTDCRFMHDLPAHRGEEVTDAVMESDASLVFEQAENRMHLAKGLLVWLLEE